MRINVHKYLVLGPTSLRAQFFARAQEMGIAEFIGKKKPSLQNPVEVQNFIDALHVLRRMTPVKQAPTDDYGSAHVIAQHVVEVAGKLEHLQEQRRVLEKEMERVAIFGNFSVPRLEKIEAAANRKVQFFFSKSGKAPNDSKREEVIYVGMDTELDYFVAINKENTSYDELIEIVIERSHNELEHELAEILRQIDGFETELGVLTHHKKILHQGLVDTLNHTHLEESTKKADQLLSDELFAVESWVPKNEAGRLFALGEELGMFVQRIQVEKKDRVPTYLKNKGTSRMGEDLINIYDVPSTTDKDPSGWVFFCFAIFFSMIVADAGYGLILLGISLFFLFKYGKTGDAIRRVLILSSSLALGCIFWGIMTTSFLGIDFSIESPVRKVSVINWMVEKKAEYFLAKKPKAYQEWVKEFPKEAGVTQPNTFLLEGVRETEGKKKYVIYNSFTDNIMMELSIFIGTIHIMLSFMRYLGRNWAGLGWIVFMAGGYLYFPLVLKAISLIHFVFGVPYEFGGQLGLYLIYGGLGLAVLLSIIQNRLGGLGEIMHVIGVFADVMSYLRIYALSLAGLIMASTFDHMGTSMPIYLGIFVILAGHTINFTLALMGGLIHGLRLNFIEWYHYSFEGGGRHFSPLKLLKIN